MKPATFHTATVPLPGPLFRGARRLRIALVGMPNSGKSTLFEAVASTSVQSGALAGTRSAYDECAVQIGLDEARVIDLPSIRSLHHLESEDRAALKYLLWGDERPPVSLHEPDGPPAPFAPPDVIVQVVDATLLEHHLELTLKLVKFGRPLVIALNKMDEACDRGLYINVKVLGARLGMPWCPPRRSWVTASPSCSARRWMPCARARVRCRSRRASTSTPALAPLASLLSRPEIQQAFRVPPELLVTQIAEGDPYFQDEMRAALSRRICRKCSDCARGRARTAAAAGGRVARRPPSPRRARCSKPRRGWARRTRAAAGATGSTNCSCIRTGA